jgi:hypothetical protein
MRRLRSAVGAIDLLTAFIIALIAVLVYVVLVK